MLKKEHKMEKSRLPVPPRGYVRFLWWGLGQSIVTYIFPQEIRNSNLEIWHISGNFSHYYAGVMLDAPASLLCSKLYGHNVDNATTNMAVMTSRDLLFEVLATRRA